MYEQSSCAFKLQYENVGFYCHSRVKGGIKWEKSTLKREPSEGVHAVGSLQKTEAGKVPSFLDFSIPFTHSVYSKKIIGIFIFGDLHLGLFPICRVRKSLVLIDVFVWALLRVCEQIVFSRKSSLGHQQSNIVSEDGVSICIQVW